MPTDPAADSAAADSAAADSAAADSAAADSVEAAEAGPIHCHGACVAEVVPLQKGAAVVTWVDEQVTWVQFMDAAAGKPLGSPRALGHLSGDEPGDRPQVVALPDGDVVFAGVLPNGRIAFARGSEVEARRVAPKTVLASEEHAVKALALAPHGNGVSLLLFREMGAVSSYAVQLQVLGARGEAQGPRREWTTPWAYTPRMAECNGTLFLGWVKEPGVVVTRVPVAGAGALGELPFSSQAFGALPQVSARFASLTCEGADARLLVGWHSSSGKAPARSSISSALLSATASGKRGVWSSIQLPAPVTARNWFAFRDAESGRSSVVIEREGKLESVPVDVSAAQVLPAPEPRSLPSSAACVPTAADRFVCADMQVAVSDKECRREESTLVYSFPGSGTAGAAATPGGVSAPGGVRREYFARHVAGIPEPERASRHFCGDAGWSELQVALANWCRDPAGAKARFATADEDEMGSFDTYCGSTPDSELYQVTHCSDASPACRPPPDQRLAVDRNGLESGSEELWLMSPDNCSVRFSGKPGAWHVAEAACMSSE